MVSDSSFRKPQQCTGQTPWEEVANVITHGLGFVLSFLGCFYLFSCVRETGTLLHRISSGVYGSTLCLAYCCSTLYHLCRNRAKQILRKLDHISIYLLITGTYMPITLLALKGAVGWTLFGIQSSLCTIGITLKSIFGYKYEALSGAFYLVMGWLIIFAIKPLITALPFYAVMWLLAGGIFYTFGFVFYALDQRYHYFHAIWHLFVLAGSFAHFYLISAYVVS